MNQQILKDLESKFTIAPIDFYDDGEVSTFVFYANEVTQSKVDELWEDYDKKYQNDEYDGAFEDYLSELNINYWILN